MTAKEKGSERESSFELLRIICCIMVIALHICNLVFFVAEKYSEGGIIALRILYSFSIVAVDVFVLLSGYFMINSNKRSLGKVITLFFMCSGYSILFYLLKCVYHGEISCKALIYSAIPQSYYVWLYCTLYIVSPYLNMLVEKFNKSMYKRLITVLLLLFVVWSSIVNCVSCAFGLEVTDIYTVSQTGTDRGFTIVNFVVLYFLGGYIRRYQNGITSKYTGLMVYVLSSVLSAILCIIYPGLASTKAVLGYDSILVVLQAVSLFDFFRQSIISTNHIINHIAKRAFGVYLIHGQIIYFLYKKMESVNEMNSSFMLVTCVLVLILVVFLISVMIDWGIGMILKPIMGYWKASGIYKKDLFEE